MYLVGRLQFVILFLMYFHLHTYSKTKILFIFRIIPLIVSNRFEFEAAVVCQLWWGSTKKSSKACCANRFGTKWAQI